MQPSIRSFIFNFLNFIGSGQRRPYSIRLIGLIFSTLALSFGNFAYAQNTCEPQTASLIQTTALGPASTQTEGGACTSCKPESQGLIHNMAAGYSTNDDAVPPGCFQIAEELQPSSRRGGFLRLQCQPETSGYSAQETDRACDPDGKIATALSKSFNASLRCINAKVRQMAANQDPTIPTFKDPSDLLVQPDEAFKLIFHESKFTMNEGTGGMMQLTRPAIQEFERGPAFNPASRVRSGDYRIWHTQVKNPSCQSLEDNNPELSSGTAPQSGFAKGYKMRAATACAFLDPRHNPDRSFVYGLTHYAQGKYAVLGWLNKERAQLQAAGFKEGDMPYLQKLLAEFYYNMGPGGAKRVWLKFLNMLPSQIKINQQSATGPSRVAITDSSGVQAVESAAKKNPSIWRKIYSALTSIHRSEASKQFVFGLPATKENGNKETRSEPTEITSFMIDEVLQGRSTTTIKDKNVDKILHDVIGAWAAKKGIATAENQLATGVSANLAAASKIMTSAAKAENPPGDWHYISRIDSDFMSFKKQAAADILKAKCPLK